MAFKVKIGRTNYDFFTSASVTSKFGRIASGFSLSALYERDNPDHIEFFKPLSYKSIEISSSRNERLMTGTALTNNFIASKVRKPTIMSGYSRAGIIQDCQIPLSTYPLQYNGLTLRQIAEKILDPFNVSLTISNDGGAADEEIDEVTAKNTDSVASFLRDIAAQRNLIISNNEFGGIEITRPNLNSAPIATYREELPATEISLSVNGQGMHSDITLLKQADIITDNAAEETINNPLVGLFRPMVKLQNIGNDNQTLDAAKNVRSNELRNIVLTIKSDRTTWLNGNRSNRVETIRPNNIISVISPENYITRRTSFFVDEVTLTADNKKEVAILKCVLPEVYSNEEPTFSFE